MILPIESIEMLNILLSRDSMIMHTKYTKQIPIFVFITVSSVFFIHRTTFEAHFGEHMRRRHN